MKERPILFNGEMVRAILEGRKTQTRRVVKLQPEYTPKNLWTFRTTERKYILTPDTPEYDNQQEIVRDLCPHGQPGDLLWVRESWYAHRNLDGSIFYRYPATDKAPSKVRPSIHMPREASRITLEITNVRVERLQDISEEDAEAEGAFFVNYGKNCFHYGPRPCGQSDEHHPQKPGWSMVRTTTSEECLGSARHAFGNLWNQIFIGSGLEWSANPWVWVIEFKILKKSKY